MRLDHYELAKEHFNAAAQSEAVALESYLPLAEIEEFRGDTLASVRWLDLARKLNQTSELPDYQEGLHYCNKGDKQRAGVGFNRAHELNPLNASILFYLAVYEREFGDPGKAISLLEQAINAYPGTLPAYYISLADWYAQAGQCSDMLSTHERLRSLIGFDSAFEPVMVEQKKSCR